MTIRRGHADGDGGDRSGAGLDTTFRGGVTLRRCTFRENIALGLGADAIVIKSEVTGCTFIDNTA